MCERDVKGPMVTSFRPEQPVRARTPASAQQGLPVQPRQIPDRTAIGAVISDAYVELTTRNLKVGARPT